MTTTTEAADLLFERDGHIATITLNRPNKLNTVTPQMGRDLFPLAQTFIDDDEIRVVILTGAGERAFSAGSDVKVLDDYGTN